MSCRLISGVREGPCDEQVLNTLRQGIVEQDVGGDDERIELRGVRCVAVLVVWVFMMVIS